jgi:hypothetical protein
MHITGWKPEPRKKGAAEWSRENGAGENGAGRMEQGFLLAFLTV